MRISIMAVRNQRVMNTLLSVAAQDRCKSTDVAPRGQLILATLPTT